MFKKSKLCIAASLAVMSFTFIGAGITLGLTHEASAIDIDKELRAYYIDGSTDSWLAHTETDGMFESAPNLHGLKASLKTKDSLVLREVINLNDFDYDDSLIKISVAPNEIGKGQFYCLKVDLIDVYNPDNYLTVQLKPYNGKTSNTYAGYYLTYASNGQYPTGRDSSSGNIHVNQWGTYATWNFAADSSWTGKLPEQQYFSFGYDIKNNAMWAHRSQGDIMFMADYDDPLYFNDTLWDGFTTGEVYARVYCEDYEESMANLVVTKWGDKDLTKAEIVDEEGPRVNVDFGEYDFKTMPTAVVGKSYDLMEAIAHDLYSGKTKVDVNVYTNYYSSKKNTVPMNKRLNTFVPQMQGTYYVEYSSVDTQKRKSTIVVEIKAVNATEEMEFSYGAYAQTVIVGEEFVLPEYVVKGGSGKKIVEISAKNANATLPVTRGVVRPNTSGKLTITYTAIDYLGQQKSETLEIDVLATDKPTFIEEPSLPLVFVAGNRYTLPTVNAYNYVDGQGKAVESTISVTNKEGVLVDGLNGNVYMPKASVENETVIVKYTASVNGKQAALEYEIPVRKVKNDEGYNLTKFFLVGDSVSSHAHEDGIDFSTIGEKGAVTLVNAISTTSVSLEWTMNEKSMGMGKFSIVLTDYYDLNNSIMLTYDMKAGGYVYVNGNESERIAMSMSFADKTTFAFAYDNLTQTASYSATASNKVGFKTNLLGESFQGFKSHKVYVTFVMQGVTTEGGFTLRDICGQFFDYSSTEWAAPNITIGGLFGGDNLVNTEITLNPAISSDVIGGEVDLYLTVTDPNGEVIKDVNGKLLNKVLVTFESEIKIRLSEYGTYFVEYYVEDASFNSNTFRYSLSVVDDQNPVIKLSGEPVIEGKVGDLIDVPSAKVIDNRDKDVKLCVYLVLPTLEMIEFDTSRKGFKAMVKGDYKIVYKATDADGNLTTLVRTITIKE